MIKIGGAGHETEPKETQPVIQGQGRNFTAKLAECYNIFVVLGQATGDLLRLARRLNGRRVLFRHGLWL